jgi:hypothetical protein
MARRVRPLQTIDSPIINASAAALRPSNRDSFSWNGLKRHCTSAENAVDASLDILGATHNGDSGADNKGEKQQAKTGKDGRQCLVDHRGNINGYRC